MSGAFKKVSVESMILVAILILATSLRVFGADFGLPYLVHPDEAVNYNRTMHMYLNDTYDPDFFNYPSFILYLNLLVVKISHILNYIFDIYEPGKGIQDIKILAMGVGKVPNPGIFFTMRLLTVTAGVAVVAITYRCGRDLAPAFAGVGLIGALFAAVSPTLTIHSRYITPDTWHTLFVLVGFWACVNVFRNGATRHYIIAGIGAGLAAGTKYGGGLIVLALPVAHILRDHADTPSRWIACLFERRLIAGCALSVAVFFATTPYALITPEEFLSGLLFETVHYATGHPGMEGNALHFYLHHMFHAEGPVTAIAMLGLVYGLVGRRPEAVLIAVFPLCYFALISILEVRNDRTFMPLLPFVFLMAAVAIAQCASAIRSTAPNFLRAAGLAASIVALLVMPTYKAGQAAYALTDTNARESRILAEGWIAEHLPAGAKILIEAYTPYVDPERFDVRGVFSMSEEDAERHLREGVDYLVFSSGVYSRFVNQPRRYPKQADRYSELFRSNERLKTFSGAGNEIRIYRVRRNP